VRDCPIRNAKIEADRALGKGWDKGKGKGKGKGGKGKGGYGQYGKGTMKGSTWNTYNPGFQRTQWNQWRPGYYQGQGGPGYFGAKGKGKDANQIQQGFAFPPLGAVGHAEEQGCCGEA